MSGTSPLSITTMIKTSKDEQDYEIHFYLSLSISINLLMHTSIRNSLNIKKNQTKSLDVMPQNSKESLLENEHYNISSATMF